MRFLLSVLSLAVMASSAIFLSSCGSSGDSADAGKSVMGILSGGFDIAPTSRFASAATKIAMDTVRSATWAAFITSAARAERHVEDVAAKHARPMTDACSALSGSAETIPGSGGASGTFTCTVACSGSGSSEVMASNCTMGTGASITATCAGTTYTANKGTFGISFPDFTVGFTPNLTSESLSFSLDLFITGGGFKSSPGSEVKLAMTFNFATLESDASSQSSFCSAVTNFSASVDGNSIACSDMANGITTCS